MSEDTDQIQPETYKEALERYKAERDMAFDDRDDANQELEIWRQRAIRYREALVKILD